MKKGRGELRGGIRAFIQAAPTGLGEFTATSAPPLPKPSPASREPVPADRPILRLVREAPTAEPMRGVEELTLHPRKGVCAAYFVNKKCWELPEAFCNQALHRSEEHTSELQSLAYLVCRLLLEKKKKKEIRVLFAAATRR